MPLKKTPVQFVFDHLDEIEHKIAMGVYHMAILADLSEAGYEMTLASFRKNLSLARRKMASKTTIYHPKSNIDPSQYLAMGRLTPEELAQLESSLQTTQRGFL